MNWRKRSPSNTRLVDGFTETAASASDSSIAMIAEDGRSRSKSRLGTPFSLMVVVTLHCIAWNPTWWRSCNLYVALHTSSNCLSLAELHWFSIHEAKRKTQLRCISELRRLRSERSLYSCPIARILSAIAQRNNPLSSSSLLSNQSSWLLRL